MIPGLVLAAGASTRMGRPKMLLPLGNGTVLSATVAPLLEAGLNPVVVVLGHDADEVCRRAGLPEDPRLRIVVNEAWRDGMSSSLRRGLEACAGATAVVVALGDQPGVQAELVRRLVQAHLSGASLALPVRGGRAGHPVLFARELWGELRSASGEKGGRDAVTRHWAEAALVEADLPRDLDTVEDYRALVEGRPPRDGEGLSVPKPRG